MVLRNVVLCMKKLFAVMLCLASLFAGCQKADKKPEIDGTQIKLSDKKITVDGEEVTSDNTQAVYIENDIVYYESGKDFTYGEGDYTLWQDDTQLAGTKSQGGGMGGMKPSTGEEPSRPDELEIPEDTSRPDGERPEMPDGEFPEKPEGERPEMPNGERPEMPEGMEGMTPPEDFDGGKNPFGSMGSAGESSTTFTIVKGENRFIGISPESTTTE